VLDGVVDGGVESLDPRHERVKAASTRATARRRTETSRARAASPSKPLTANARETPAASEMAPTKKALTGKMPPERTV